MVIYFAFKLTTLEEKAHTTLLFIVAQEEKYAKMYKKG